MTKTDYKLMGAIGIISFIAYVLFTNILPVTDPVESNYVLTAKEMLQKGSFISPIIYGHAWYDKPPITYWFLMLSFKLFGYTNFAARLPATLTATANIVAIYAATKSLLGDRIKALWAAIILGTTVEFWYISHAIVTDGYLFLASIGIFTFSYLALTKKKASSMRWAYVCAGFAVLAKGPVGLVLPGLILLLFLLWQKDAKGLKTLFDPLGIILFILVSFPWYIAMYEIHGWKFIEGFLGLHNVVRATISEHPSQDVWYYYLALTPIYLLPWLGYTVKGLCHSFKESPFRKFQLLWLVLVIAFYTLVATKYITYTFIALIPLVIITAEGVTELREHPFAQRWKSLLMLIPFLLLTIILMIGAEWEPHIHSNSTLMISLGIFFILVMIRFALWGNPQRYPKLIALMMALLITSLPITIQPLIQVRSSEMLSQQIESYKPDQVYFLYYYRTSYDYYTGRTPILITDPIKRPPNIWSKGKDVMPTRTIQDLDAHYDGNQRIIFLVGDKNNATFTSYPIYKHFHLIGHYDKFNIYANYKVDVKKNKK